VHKAGIDKFINLEKILLCFYAKTENAKYFVLTCFVYLLIFRWYCDYFLVEKNNVVVKNNDYIMYVFHNANVSFLIKRSDIW